MSQFLMTSHAIVTKGHLHSHTKIFVKQVPDNVPNNPIYFLLQEYRLNHGLIRCFLNRLEFVESSWCDSDQRKSSQNLFYYNLESSWCDSNLQNFCAKLFQLRNYFRA